MRPLGLKQLLLSPGPLSVLAPQKAGLAEALEVEEAVSQDPPPSLHPLE